MAAVAVLAIGAGISAYASYQQGIEKQQSFEFQAAARRAQAAQTQVAANRDISLIQRQGDIVSGAEKAAFGQSGVTTQGSPLIQLEQTAAVTREKINATQENASYNEANSLGESSYDTIEGNQAYQAGELGAFGSVLTGASRAFGAGNSPRVGGYP